MSSYLLTTLTTKAPEAEDVTAGWIGAVVLIGLVLAVVFLGFSLVKQLRKAQAAEDAGVYGHNDEPRGRSTRTPTPTTASRTPPPDRVRRALSER